MMRRLAPWAAAVILLTMTAPAVAFQDSDQVRITELSISRYPEVTMVVDLAGVEQFDADGLTITEDGVPVELLSAQPISQSAVRVGIVLAIDVSSRMAGDTLEAARSAALSFVESMRTQDRVAIIGFGGGEQIIVTPFTDSKEVLAAAINSLQADPGADQSPDGETPPSSGSRLYDAVLASVDQFGTVPTGVLEPNLLILTAGGPVTGQAGPDEAAAALAAQGVSVYGVLVGPDGGDGAALRALVGGGTYLATPDPAALASLSTQIRRSLDGRIVVRFLSAHPEAGDVTMAASYQGVTASMVVGVPGFEAAGTPTTTIPPTYAAPNAGPAGREVPLGLTALMLIGTGGIALAILLFILLVAMTRADGLAALSRRLRNYGAATRLAGADRSGLLARLPLMSRFANRAEAAAERRGFLHPINALLEQTNLLWRPGEAVAAALGGAALVGLAVGALRTNIVEGAIVFALLVVAIAAAISTLASRERRRFDAQLPETLALLATSLRSGQSFMQAMESVAAEAPEPTAREFQRGVAEVRLGRAIGRAMEGIAGRMQSPDFEWVVMATDIQREVGGNLAEVLDIVADTMLQRNRLRRDIHALSAEGRISGYVLVSLPFIIASYLWLTNRNYLRPLIEKSAGWLMLGAAAVMVVAAMLWLRKILDIEV